MEFTSRGRTWREVSREPYTRKDGSQTELITWQIKCAKCDEMVRISTPAVNFEKSNAWGATHCPAHKIKKGEIFEYWRAQKKANSQPGADLV